MSRLQSHTALAFVGLVALALFLGCERRERDVASAIEADSAAAGPQQVSWNARFLLQEDGQRRAHFRAAKMEHYETEDSTYAVLTVGSDSVKSKYDSVDTDRDGPGSRSDSLHDVARAGASGTSSTDTAAAPRVYAYIFDEKGDSSAVITADRMMYFDAEGRFEAFGDVEVVTTDEKRLFSEQLTWEQTDRKIRTRRFVRIVTPTETVQGNGLVADEDLETYQIGRFTAEVTMEDDEDASTETGASPDPSRSTPSDTPEDTTARSGIEQQLRSRPDTLRPDSLKGKRR